MAFLNSILCCLTVFFLAVPASGNAFLGRVPEAGQREVSATFANMLLAEIESILGSEHRSFTEKRLDRIQEDLQPIFASMPKNAHGRLEHTAVTYVLHRVFVQRHGWLVRGFSADVNSSTSTRILEDRVPDYVVQLFEKRIGSRGIDLHDLAIMAATFEHLIHQEAMARLRIAYNTHNFTLEDVMSSEEADDVMDSYMVFYILGNQLESDGNPAGLAPQHVQDLQPEDIQVVYPFWNETQKFIRDVKHSVAPQRDYLYFADVANVIEEVGERYGKWQDQECLQLKDQLIAIEDVKGSGRVLLADFYRKALHEGDWQFSESSSYLQQHGALDNSDPKRPRLLITNYMLGPSNCVAASSYYSVCCRDTCETILGQFEKMIAKPDASVGELIAIATALPSTSWPDKQTLTPWLKQRLEEVAEHHGGRIPLHGRLFAQWMHFAYPRDCAYPHLSGTISPVEPREFMNDTDSEFSATHEEMMQYEEMMQALRSSRSNPSVQNGDPDEEPCMWTMAEELLGKQHTPKIVGLGDRLGTILFGGNVAVLGLLASLSFGLVRLRGQRLDQKSSPKFYV